MKKTLILTAIFSLIFVFAFNVCLVAAQGEAEGEPEETGGDPVPKTGGDPVSGALENPLGNLSFAEVTKRTIDYVLGVVGVLALISFVYGGTLWLISYGDPAKIKKGKDIMTWAVWGIAIIFGAYAILRFIFEAFLGAK